MLSWKNDLPHLIIADEHNQEVTETMYDALILLAFGMGTVLGILVLIYLLIVVLGKTLGPKEGE